MMFGQGEGLRLIGIALIETDPESSAICFIRSLIKKTAAAGLEKKEITAWLDIIAALLSACSENSPVFMDMNELSAMLEAELYTYFSIEKEALLCSDPIKRIQMLKEILNKKTEGRTMKNDLTTVNPQACREAAREPVQLELFQE